MYWTTDVLNIMMMYVEANDLVPFFIQNELDFRRNFRYDALGKIGDRELNVFPNMSVVSACITLKYYPDALLHGLKSIICRGDYEYYAIVDSLIGKCLNVEKIIFDSIHVTNFSFLENHVKLRSITFIKCMWSTISHIFYPKCLNLHTLIFSCLIDDNDVRTISQCINLKTLKVCGLKCSKDTQLCCPNLRNFEMDDRKTHRVSNLNALIGCKNLRVIKLVECHGLLSGWNFGVFINLRYIILVKCDSLENMSGMEECRKLRKVKLDKCKRLKNVYGLDKCKRLRIISL